ncbi:hypothetical protein Vi05172_g6695 [Venturia inaequalis]|nr:hypothetical protein Vi05172_g6695 [Venturia inaequalis]
MLSFKSILFVLSAIFHTIYAVEVAPNSPCSQSCIDFPNGNISDTAASHTTEKDVVCNDWEYTGENSTTVGQKFKACNNCEQYSPAIDSSGGENDLYWFLFNLKSTVVWCVFGVYGSTTSSQPTRAYNACNSACQPIAPALLDKLQVTNQDLQYNYCNASNNAFNSGVDACAKCLSTVSNVQMIGNSPSAGKDTLIGRKHFQPPWHFHFINHNSLFCLDFCCNLCLDFDPEFYSYAGNYAKLSFHVASDFAA